MPRDRAPEPMVLRLQPDDVVLIGNVGSAGAARDAFRRIEETLPGRRVIVFAEAIDVRLLRGVPADAELVPERLDVSGA